MTVRRYARTTKYGLDYKYGISYAVPTIRENIKNGNIRYDSLTLSEGDRLDILAGKIYGDGKLWWILAAASGIGFGLQVPAGTLILVPDLSDLSKYVG
jgi:phage tail protein X